jgi:uncharacterized membrane protein YdbT with pleckstrin-like domain
MSSYVNNILSDNESVLLSAKLHWINYVPAIIWLAIVVALVTAIEDDSASFLTGLIGTSIVIASLLLTWLKHWTTELAITDRRVVAKTGLIARNTNELNRAKIEGVDVQQSILGRLLDYGTISVRGTGGSIAPIPRISNPIAFRKAVHAE